MRDQEHVGVPRDVTISEEYYVIMSGNPKLCEPILD